MPIIPDNRLFAIAQRGFRRDAVEMFKQLGADVRGVILANANADGSIPSDRLSRIQIAAGRLVDRTFVGIDGRSAFGLDGVSALAEYPRLLNKWYVYAVGATVYAHHRWLKRTMPEDVFDLLAQRRSRPVPVMQSAAVGQPVREGRALNWEDLTDEQIEALRLFSPNPLAEYEPMHTWVDPNGYRLSDRIWQTDVRTRMALDALLADAIRNGMGAQELANLAEQFLNPDRAKLRTKKPYGRDASYDAMRLARTEIARAANQASYIAGYLNPYCGGLDVARSPQGDPTCPICPMHATIDIGGRRIRDPYGYEGASIPPYHPNDMCRVQNNVRDNPSIVTQRLRALLQDADLGGREEPLTNAATPEKMLSQMLGDVLYEMLVRYFQTRLL